MRIAYHPTGDALTRYALSQWIYAAKADIAAAPGLVIRVSDPKHPYARGREVLADDRETLGGQQYSRIRGLRRRLNLEFNLCKEDEEARWQAWHEATLGGRVAFVIEEPLTRELIAVTARVSGLVTRRETYRRYQPATLELIEWS